MPAKTDSGVMVIDDQTADEHLFPRWHGRGLLSARGYKGTAAQPFPKELLIPRSEFQARVQERKQLGLGLMANLNREKIPPLNQEQTNYCWANAITNLVRTTRVMQNQAFVELSAASIAAPIRGYRNEGGNGDEALSYVFTNGIVPTSLWPANYWMDARYHTPTNLEVAKKYRVLDWFELDANNLDQLISLLLQDIPVGIGYSWWQHEVMGVDVEWLDGAAWPVIWNSWGPSWGSNGFGTIQGNRAYPSDGVATLQARAS